MNQLTEDVKASILAQLEVTLRDEHHIWGHDWGVLLPGDLTTVTPQQAVWYLDTGEVEEVNPTCGEDDCCRLEHLEVAVSPPAQEDKVDMMIATLTRPAYVRQTPSLASLFKKAKSAGLLVETKEY